MQDVPKIVLKRLQETAGAEAHPDADLLTAFAEESLAGSERARVMDHLARCGDCREVVALALPATESVELVAAAAAARHSRSGWLLRPVLRWSVATVGIVALISVGIVQYRQRQKSDALGSNLVARNEAVATPEQLSPRSPTAPDSQSATPRTENEQKTEKQAELRKKALPSPPASLSADKFARAVHPNLPKARAMLGAGAAGGALAGSGGGVAPLAALPSSPLDTPAAAGNLRSATPEEAAKPAPNLGANQVAEAPSSSQTVEVESQAAPVTSTAENQLANQLIESQKQQASQQDSSKGVGVVATKGFATAQNASGALSLSSRWSISADGILQRSFDAGHTWVDVNVNSEPAANGSRMASAAESTRKDGKKKKDKAQPNLVFRALGTQGAEVWAGGSAAMLYHSSDNGDHWARVRPSSDGATLSGDITSIEFYDPQHGRIATSAGEVWVTADNGQTWRRQ